MKYEDRELLSRIVHYYHERLFEEDSIKSYLQKVGLHSQETCINFRLGYSDGHLKNAFPDDEDSLNKLKRIAILTDSMDETLKDCLVVPIRSEGKTFASLAGINIIDGKETFLPGNEALFNIEALKASKEIYLTDSLLNALLLYSIGLRETVAIIGESIIDTHLKLFEKYQTKSITLLVAKHNIAKFSKKIKSQGIAVGVIDIDSKSLPRLVVEGLKKDYCLSLVKEPEINPAEPIVEERGEEIFYEFEDRRYRVRRLDPFRLDCLRVNLKATHQNLWHLDTVDLYAERQRRNFITMAAKLIRLDKGFLHQDLLKITEDLEDRQAKIILEKKESSTEMPPHEKEEAMKFLRADDMTGEILKDFTELGIVGEENNILIGYLALLSRKLTHPISILLNGSESAGKDTLKNTLLDVIPEEDIERFTKLSPQALFYRDELSIQHKILVIDDESCLADLDYILSSLQNRGLSYSVTHKNPETGKLRSHDYNVKGPVSLFVTTSDTKSVKKLMNHFITLRVDESESQTEKILAKQREDEMLESILKEKKLDLIKRKHRNAQRLLKPCTIVNNYAKTLDYDEKTLDARNLQPKYLSLIKTICFLRQYQKEVKKIEETGEYIEVDLIDIEIANHLMNEIMKNRCPLHEDTSSALKAINELIEEKMNINNTPKIDVTFTRKELSVFSHLSDNVIRTVLNELVETKYIEVIAGSKGKTMLYKLAKDIDLVKPCEFKVTRSENHNSN